MRRIKTHVHLLLLVSSPWWLETVGHGDTIDHGELDPGTHVGTAEGPQGCDPLPEDPVLIPGLRSGWLYTTSGGQLRVVLSDSALPCPDPDNPSAMSATLPPCSGSAWLLGFDLPEELRAVGVYELTEHAVNWHLVQQFSDEPSLGCASTCGTSTITGGVSVGGRGPDARLELFSINEHCITGRIAELDQSGQILPPPPQLNGAFRLLRCDTVP